MPLIELCHTRRFTVAPNRESSSALQGHLAAEKLERFFEFLSLFEHFAKVQKGRLFFFLNLLVIIEESEVQEATAHT